MYFELKLLNDLLKNENCKIWCKAQTISELENKTQYQLTVKLYNHLI